MKRKTVKIMAMLLAATMMLGTVTVGAEELEVLDSGSISVNEDASDQELSLDEDVLAEDPSFAEDTNYEAVSYDGTDIVFGASTGETDVIDNAETDDAGEEFNASVESSAKGTKLSKQAANVFKKIGGKKKKSFMYKKLSKNEKKLYDKIDNEVNRILYKGGKLVKEKGSNYYDTKDFYTGKPEYDQFDKIFEIYKLDNPQAFFLSIGLSGAANKKRSKYRHYARVWDETKSAAKIKERGEKIAKNLNEYAKIVKKEKGDYKKAYKILELLCTRLDTQSGGGHGLLDTFYRNNGDKESYAVAYTALARLSGLEAYTVLGDKGDPYNGHWVRVRIGKKWYNIDLFKSDWIKDYKRDSQRGYNLEYFLKSDSTLKKDGEHNIEKKYSKFYPKAEKKDYPLPIN